jgi:hypothetical protein
MQAAVSMGAAGVAGVVDGERGHLLLELRTAGEARSPAGRDRSASASMTAFCGNSTNSSWTVTH